MGHSGDLHGLWRKHSFWKGHWAELGQRTAQGQSACSMLGWAYTGRGMDGPFLCFCWTSTTTSLPKPISACSFSLSSILSFWIPLSICILFWGCEPPNTHAWRFFFSPDLKDTVTCLWNTGYSGTCSKYHQHPMPNRKGREVALLMSTFTFSSP